MKNHFVITYKTKDGAEATIKIDQPTEEMALMAAKDLFNFGELIQVKTEETLEAGLVKCQGYNLHVEHGTQDLTESNVFRIGDQIASVYPDLDLLRQFLNENIAKIRLYTETVRQAAVEIEDVAKHHGVDVPFGEIKYCIHAGVRITEFCHGLSYQVTQTGPAAFEEVIRNIVITPEGIFIPVHGEGQARWQVDLL